jgi:Ca-activated chloride channel family protein
MKKILISVSVIAIAAIVVVGATTAFFTDTETSVGNTFTAGAIDLKVDSQQHYNNAVCNSQGVWELETGATATNPQYPVIGNACGGTWGQTPEGKDIVSEKFFDFADVKPGDSGENTISLHVVNNDAWVCAIVSNLTNSDNTQTEPESSVDANGLATGELQQNMVWTVWRDDGDNIMNGSETALLSGHPVNGVLAVYDSSTGVPLTGNSTTYLGVKWELPLATGSSD